MSSFPHASRSEGSTLSRDEIYDLLSNRRRRYAIHAVKQADESLELTDLARLVAGWENEKAPGEVTTEERHRVSTSIQQTHLPAMEEADVLECTNGTIAAREGLAYVDVYLDVVSKGSIPWAQYYLGLSVIASGLLAAVWIGLFPEGVPTLAWGVLVVALFLVSSLYHVWENRQIQLGVSGKPPETEQ